LIVNRSKRQIEGDPANFQANDAMSQQGQQEQVMYDRDQRRLASRMG